MSGEQLLRRALRGERRTIGLAALVMMSWQACEALVPVAVGAIIDRAIEEQDGGALVVGLVGLAVLFTVLSLSFRFGWRRSVRASETAAHRLRTQIAAAILDPRRPVGDRPAGELVAIASSDAARVGELASVVPWSAGSAVSLTVATVVLVTISVPLGVLVVVGAPLVLFAMHRLGGPLERRAEAEQERAAETAALATDLVVGLRVLKGIGAGDAAADRYRSASRTGLGATLRAAVAEAIFNAATLLLTLVFLAIVALVAGRYAAAGHISVGELVAAVGVAQFLLGPLEVLAGIRADLARARASAARIAPVLGVPPAASAVAAQLTDGGGLTSGALVAAPGELLGVAAGAEDAHALVTTLSEAAPDLGGRALVARHDAVLFGGTLIDNVRAAGATSEMVTAALAAADADQVVETLPDGGATVLGERGRTLSGGQRQRVALARALAADAEVLVLHDPTTAVDVATEARVATGLRDFRAGRTTVLVTTSAALLAGCGRVVLLRDGAVAAEGTHAQLAGRADYRELTQR